MALLAAGVVHRFLAVVSALFAGGPGVLGYLAATVVGLEPVQFHARRALLMDMLIGLLIVV